MRFSRRITKIKIQTQLRCFILIASPQGRNGYRNALSVSMLLVPRLPCYTLLQPWYAKCLHHVRTFWNISSCFKSWQKCCSLSGRRRMEERKHRFTSRVALPAAAAAVRFLHAPLHRQLDRPPTQPPPSPISLEAIGCSRTLFLHTLTSNNINFAYLFCLMESKTWTSLYRK